MSLASSAEQNMCTNWTFNCRDPGYEEPMPHFLSCADYMEMRAQCAICTGGGCDATCYSGYNVNKKISFDCVRDTKQLSYGEGLYKCDEL